MLHRATLATFKAVLLEGLEVVFSDTAKDLPRGLAMHWGGGLHSGIVEPE
jgi:hypothetical protein